MRLTRRLGSVAILSLLILVLALPAGPVTAEEGLQTAVPASLGDVGDAGPMFAVSGCFADPTGDTTRGAQGPREDSPQADISQYCVDYNAASIGLSMTVPGGTNPLTDPVWNNFGAAVAYLYDTAAGERREIQLSTQRDDGVFEYFVLEGQVAPTLVCSGSAQYQEGGTYVASIPADCLAAPDPIRLLGTFGYDTSQGRENVLTDAAPADGGFVAVPLSAPDGAERITRFEGPSRVETAIATSLASYPGGDAGAVLVALADNFPDALVAAPLAVTESGPVLLTQKDSVPQSVRDEALRALGGPGKVILLGGTAALSDVVLQTMESDGHTVTRVAGDSRFSTSVAVAEAANDAPEQIFLAFGGDFPDALLAGATSPTFQGVAVLVDRGGIPGVVQDYLDAHPEATVFAIGNVASEVAPEGSNRATGTTPSSISAALLDLYPDGGEITFASSEKFPDGLSGGAYAAANGLPMILSPEFAMEGPTLDALAERGPYSQMTFVGGEFALSNTVAGQASAYLSSP